MSGIFSVIFVCSFFYLRMPSTATKSYPFGYKFLCIFTRIKVTRRERQGMGKRIFAYEKVTFSCTIINMGLCIMHPMFSIQHTCRIASRQQQTFSFWDFFWFEEK